MNHGTNPDADADAAIAEIVRRHRIDLLLAPEQLQKMNALDKEEAEIGRLRDDGTLSEIEANERYWSLAERIIAVDKEVATLKQARGN